MSGNHDNVSSGTENHFVAQCRRDLAGGLDPSIVLSYVRYHIGGLRNLHPVTDEKKQAIAEAKAFADELEAVSGNQ